MLRNIMSRHNVMPEFLSAVRCFQDKTSNIEQAFGGASWKICAQSSKGMLPGVFPAPSLQMIKADNIRRDGFRLEVSRAQRSKRCCRPMVNSSDLCIPKL